MPDIQASSITVVPSLTRMIFPQDFLVSLQFRDSRSNELLADYTGPSSILASALLPALPTETLASMIATIAPEVLLAAARERTTKDDKTVDLIARVTLAKLRSSDHIKALPAEPVDELYIPPIDTKKDI